VIVASPGGEEEIVQQVETASAAASPRVSPTATISETPTPTPSAITTGPPTSPAPPGYADYTEPGGRYSVRYPTKWQVNALSGDDKIRDFLRATQFIGSDGFTHASIYVFQNPNGSTLEDWIAEHNPIFLDHPPEERTISGQRALFSGVSAVGLPTGAAYLQFDGLVINVSGLSPADFDDLVTGFRLSAA
jgi:hypothetical protein